MDYLQTLNQTSKAESGLETFPGTKWSKLLIVI